MNLAYTYNGSSIGTGQIADRLKLGQIEKPANGTLFVDWHCDDQQSIEYSDQGAKKLIEHGVEFERVACLRPDLRSVPAGEFNADPYTLIRTKDGVELSRFARNDIRDQGVKNDIAKRYQAAEETHRYNYLMYTASKLAQVTTPIYKSLLIERGDLTKMQVGDKAIVRKPKCNVVEWFQAHLAIFQLCQGSTTLPWIFDLKLFGIPFWRAAKHYGLAVTEFWDAITDVIEQADYVIPSYTKPVQRADETTWNVPRSITLLMETKAIQPLELKQE
jgi:hypothetical protein